METMKTEKSRLPTTVTILPMDWHLSRAFKHRNKSALLTGLFKAPPAKSWKEVREEGLRPPIVSLWPGLCSGRLPIALSPSPSSTSSGHLKGPLSGSTNPLENGSPKGDVRRLAWQQCLLTTGAVFPPHLRHWNDHTGLRQQRSTETPL